MFSQKKDYRTYAKSRAARSHTVKNCLLAYFFGGMICVIAECLYNVFKMYCAEDTAATLVSVTLIFIASLLTCFGVFDKIAKHAGAGTLVPITGFSNAMTSPALDTRSDERDIIGLSRKAP